MMAICLLFYQELEAERVTLMEDVTANKRKMKELEDNLLYRLTSTQVHSFCYLFDWSEITTKKFSVIEHMPYQRK